jgi:hypothetical protein
VIGMLEMYIKSTVRVPANKLFDYELGNVPGYLTKMITVAALPYGLKVECYEPSFLERLFGVTIEKKIDKARQLLLKEIEREKRWDALCHTLEKT